LGEGEGGGEAMGETVGVNSLNAIEIFANPLNATEWH